MVREDDEFPALDGVLKLLHRRRNGEFSIEGGVTGFGIGEPSAEERQELELSSVVLMEYTSDGCVRGVCGERANGVADEEGGVGDGELHLIDRVEHVRHVDEPLLAGGQGVSQGADNVGKAGQESEIKITHAQQPLNIQLGGGRGKLLIVVTFSGKGQIPSESTM